jgi:flagellar assembly factor FliW
VFSAHTVVVVRTTRPGDLRSSDEAKEMPMTLVHTPDGLPGFDGVHAWELESDDTSSFSLLRNVEQPSIGLLVTAPWDLAPGYEPDLPDDELARLGVVGPAEVEVLVVATIAPRTRPDQPLSIWLNLAAPIVVNTRTSAARQVILDRQGWPLRHPVMAEG